MNPTRTDDSAPRRIDRFRGEHAFLSNFHPAPFRWRGRDWPTAEAAFAASKTLDERERERIRTAPSPGHAKRLGRRVKLRPDWERIKDDVMRSLLEAKFAAPELRDALLATGDAVLVEGNTWGRRLLGRLQRPGPQPARPHAHAHSRRHPPQRTGRAVPHPR